MPLNVFLLPQSNAFLCKEANTVSRADTYACRDLLGYQELGEMIDLNQHIHCEYRHWLEHNCCNILVHTSAPGIVRVNFLQ